MPDEVLQEGIAAPETVDTTETVSIEEKEKPDATVTSEESGETDEQKNERVQREEAERTRQASEKKARGVQKRIDELTADKHAERKRADELAQQNARILALLEGKSDKVATSGEPVREQFEDYEKYTAALARYEAKQEAKALFEEAQKTQREATQKLEQERTSQQVQREYHKRQTEVAKAIPDFYEVMEDADISVPNHVLDMVMRMPDGPTIAYHMAKQPDLAKQFWDQPPYMHGIILGQLSATLKGTPKVSTAPAPGKPAASKPAASNSPPTDPEQYFAWAEKHMPRR
jgi:hypothetical protein